MYTVTVPTTLSPEEHGQGSFTLYRLQVQAKTRCRVDGALPRTMSWSCDKRYSDFVVLRQGLGQFREPPQAVADIRALPALPPKVWLGSSLDPTLVETRRALLEQFFQQLVLIPAVSQLVAAFVEQPAELLMSSDEDEPEDEEEAAERAKRRRLAVLEEAERLSLRLYKADTAVPTRELLDFVLQNAEPSFLKSRRLATSAQQVNHTWSRGRAVRAFKRLIGQLRRDMQPAPDVAPATLAVAPVTLATADRADQQIRSTRWHHTRRRLPATGWCRFTDTESIEAYYHASVRLVTYEHVLLTKKLDRVAELREKIERISALRSQGGSGVPSLSSSTAEQVGSVELDHQQRELDAELADAEREAARVAEAVQLEAEVKTLRNYRASNARLVQTAGLRTVRHDLQQPHTRAATSSNPVRLPAPQSLREAELDPEPASPTLDLNGTCKLHSIRIASGLSLWWVI